MSAYLRMRQICLAAPALRPAVEDITAVLGTEVCYRDPGVAKYGLENALFALGPDVLEVVAPTQEGTAVGRFLERTGGRGGYMAILDCDDPERRQAHAAAMGVRTTHLIQHDGYYGAQLHPRDCRGAMVEFNRTEGGEDLAGPYHPAGPDWPAVVARSAGAPTLLVTEMDSPDPAGLAAHWGKLMEVPVTSLDGAPCLTLTRGRVVFLPGEAERMGGLRIAIADPARAVARAEARGLRQADGQLWLSGVRLTLLPKG